MSTFVYSNPFLHTAYYSHSIFEENPGNEFEHRYRYNSQPIIDANQYDRLTNAFLYTFDIADGIEYKDFRFNENIHCTDITNGICMGFVA